MICFVDYRTTENEINSLKKLNYDVIKIPKDNNLYEAINGHTDIQLNILNKNTIIINKNINLSFKELLKTKNINFIESNSTLSSKYPSNISLNAYITDNYLVHNLKFTDKKILDYCKNKKTINVNQGYTKCSILPLREKVIITNDTGIYNTLKNEGFDILLLPFGDIELSGFNYGFIGGVGGMISNDSMAFFGSLDNYAFGNEVKKFLYKYDIKPIYLSNTKLIDRFNLSTLIERIALLNKKVENLYLKIEKEELSPAGNAAVNELLLKLSQKIVRITFHGENHFDFDLSGAMYPIQSLADGERLANCEKGSYRYHVLRTQLLRGYNRVMCYVGDAISLLEDFEKNN